MLTATPKKPTAKPPTAAQVRRELERIQGRLNRALDETTDPGRAHTHTLLAAAMLLTLRNRLA